VSSIPIDKFKNNIQDFIQQVINQHIPLKITDQNGGEFIIVSAEDWEQQQETLFVLQNSQIMEQITRSLATHTKNKGYIPNQEELDKILSI